jgi:hypothetical protein
MSPPSGTRTSSFATRRHRVPSRSANLPLSFSNRSRPPAPVSRRSQRLASWRSTDRSVPGRRSEGPAPPERGTTASIADGRESASRTLITGVGRPGRSQSELPLGPESSRKRSKTRVNDVGTRLDPGHRTCRARWDRWPNRPALVVASGRGRMVSKGSHLLSLSVNVRMRRKCKTLRPCPCAAASVAWIVPL